jgi:peptidoglycan/LPS O-acetylase OafA/YrhL
MAIERLRYIDTWRAVAVSLVILSHLPFSKSMADALASHGIRGIFGYGRLGVMLFFFISGFVVTKACLAEAKAGTFTASGFYIKRAFRIVPPFLLYLLACVALGYAGVIQFTAQHFFSSFLYLCNTSLPAADCGELGTHAWSLSFEEQFYLLFAWVFLFLHGRQRPGWLALVLILPIALLPFVWPLPWMGRSGFLFTYALFALGYLCARFETRIRSAIGRRAPVLFVAGAAICFFRPELLGRFGVQMQTPDYYGAYVLGVPLLVLSSGMLGDVAGRLFNLGWLAYLGRISYSIYLWQQLFTLGAPFTMLPPWWHLGALAAMVAGCAALFWLVETPLIKLGRSLARRQAEESRRNSLGNTVSLGE